MPPTQRPAPRPATWADLVDAVRAAQPGMYILSMETLRDLEGGKRADKAVPGILDALQDRSIGHLPEPLPVRADALVALYLRGTEVGDFAAAVIAACEGEPLTSGSAKALAAFGRSVADDAALEKLQAMVLEAEERIQRSAEFLEQIQPSRRGRRR